MGFWNFLSGTTPEGVISSTGQKVVAGVFDGITELIKTVHLAPEEELKFKTGLAQIQLQTQQGMWGDMNSARQMQMATRSFVPPLLAISVTIGFFGLLGFLFTHPVPPENKDILNIMLGSLGTAWVMVMTFYFGDSHGSQMKTGIIGDIAKGS